MNIKRFIYTIIKYPLILIFLKTPFIYILKKKFKNNSSSSTKNIFWNLLNTLFQKEYFNKLSNKEEIRNLINSPSRDKEQTIWTQSYYDKHFQTLEELKRRQIGKMSGNDATPIFENIINFINSNNLSEDKNTYIIQLGS